MSGTTSKVFLVRGVSMEPVLRTGDRVKLRPAERNELRCGDIIVYTAANGREIIHRVVSLTPLQTRGDHCCKDDPPVPEDSHLFSALSFCRNGRISRLSSGNSGMREFRRNQFRSQLLSSLRKVFLPLADCNPFRIPFQSLKPVSFSDKTVYYAGKHPVGWIDDKGWHWRRYARHFVEAPPENFHE